MPERDRTPLMPPASTEETTKPSEARRIARLDAALRANLKRRKTQLRSRGLADEDTLRDTPSIVKASKAEPE